MRGHVGEARHLVDHHAQTAALVGRLAPVVGEGPVERHGSSVGHHGDELGEQLALLLDGAAARSRVLDASTFPTAAAIAAVLVDTALPQPTLTPSEKSKLPTP